jgi:Holliday junction resolvasome RuvABC DNA-binding subunit
VIIVKVEGSMAAVSKKSERKWAVQILESGLTPLSKVRKLVALGYAEEAADEMVTEAQVGPSQAMFYEQLPRPEYEVDPL